MTQGWLQDPGGLCAAPGVPPPWAGHRGPPGPGQPPCTVALRVECLPQAGARDSHHGGEAMRPPPPPPPRKFPPSDRHHARQSWEGQGSQQVWADRPVSLIAHEQYSRKILKPRRGKARPETSREATRGPAKDQRRPRSDSETATPGTAQGHKRAASDPTQR